MKNTIWFFSFETLGRMHKNIYFFQCFLYFLKVLTQTGYFNTGFVFLPCKILPDINKNNIKTTRKKYIYIKCWNKYFQFFLLKWVGSGPNTWAGPRPCEQCPPLFTCYVNSGGVAGTQQEKEEGEKGWPAVAATVGCATGSDRRRRWWPVTLFFFSLSPLFYVLFLLFSSSFFFSFSPLFSLLSSALYLSLGLSVSLFPLFSVLFFFPFPCFYRQKQGRETWLGRPLCCRPEPPKGYVPFLLPPRGKQVGCRRLFERELAVEQKKKSSSSSPTSRVQGKKKTWVPFKTAPFPAFLITVHETASFFSKTRRFI